MSTGSTIEGWFALGGVVLGYALGEVTGIIRRRVEIRRRRALIQSELRSVLAQLPQKRDLLQKALVALRKHELLPLKSVRVLTAGYESVLADLYPHLTDLQRNCLHVIYERLRVGEAFMESYESTVLAAVQEGKIEDPWVAYVGMIEDMLASYDVVDDLAKSYLSGSPRDVFYIRKA